MFSKNILNIATTIVIALTMLCACKTSKPGSGSINGENASSFNTTIESYRSWNTLRCNGKIKLEGNRSASSSIQMKMIRDKSMTISVRPILGIELFKVQISGDTLYLIDRTSSRYVKESISSYLNGFEVSIEAVQNLFIGRPFIVSEGSMTRHSNVRIEAIGNGKLQISPEEQFGNIVYSFITDAANRIERLKVEGVGSMDISANYSGFSTTDFGVFPNEVNINLSSGNTHQSLRIEYNAGSIRWNDDFTDAIEIPKGYSRTSIKSYIK